MPGLQIKFNPFDFNFLWSGEQYHFYYLNKPRVILYEDIDVNREKIYRIEIEGQQVYCGYINTKVFAAELFKNLGI